MPAQLGPADHQLRDYLIPFEFPDVAAASSVYVPVMWAGTLVEIIAATAGAIDGANSVITASRLPAGVVANAVALTPTLVLTTAGAGVGKTYSAVFTGPANGVAVTFGDSIRLTSDGGATTANKAQGTIRVRR